MNIKSNTSVFALCLALSLAAHAAVLAWWHVSRPVTDAQLAFSVEILPLQAVASAPALASASAPASAPARPEPQPTRAPAPPQRALPAPRVPDAPSVSVERTESAAPSAPAAAPAESARSTDKEVAAVAERKAEPGPPPAAAVPSSDAAYLRNALTYPPASIRNNEQGTVLVKVLVARDGTVLRAELEKSSGWPNLDAAAVRSVRAWHFTPARRGDEAIEKEYLVPAAFRLENARR